jgi:hypothetical protein
MGIEEEKRGIVVEYIVHYNKNYQEKLRERH